MATPMQQTDTKFTKSVQFAKVQVASASTIDLSAVAWGTIVELTGTSQVNTISGAAAGTVIFITRTSTAIVNDDSVASGNVKLNPYQDTWDPTTYPSETYIALIFDGTDWHELLRGPEHWSFFAVATGVAYVFYPGIEFNGEVTISCYLNSGWVSKDVNGGTTLTLTKGRNFDVINGGSDIDVHTITPVSNGREIHILKRTAASWQLTNSGGNLQLHTSPWPTNPTDANQGISLVYNTTSSKWHEVSRSG
jgi:hypothetical protein